FRGRNAPEGVLRVDYAGLNATREEGMENAKRLDLWKSGKNYFAPKRSFLEMVEDFPSTNFDALKTEYEHFMEDVSAYLGKKEAPKRETFQEWFNRDPRKRNRENQ
ncbi:MAG: hypothetical protein PHE68_04100, partial [Candidatus Peribacteraceae bacterium]|nr:hypothetical protein [Candidatus Peribacteraceae bacterium]